VTFPVAAFVTAPACWMKMPQLLWVPLIDPALKTDPYALKIPMPVPVA
jgi:hypothetical protein